MIKLKKIAAIVMAATMVMGLSMTASAMDISSPMFIDNPTAVGLTEAPVLEDADGEEINMAEHVAMLDQDSAAAKSVSSAKKMANVLAESGYELPDGATAVPIYSAYLYDITTKTKAADGGYTFTFKLSNFDATGQSTTQFTKGSEIYAMIETGVNTGTWEVVPLTVGDDGEVEATVNHDGAFVLFKVLDNGKIVKLETDGNNGVIVNPPVDPDDPSIVDPGTPINPEEPGTSTEPSNGQNANGAANANGAVNGANGVWTSPKTGEF